MSEVFALAPGAKELFTFDWSAEFPASSPAASISSVSYSISPSASPQQLYQYTTSTDFPNFLSSVGLTGAISGVTYQVKALCTWSNGEIVTKNITVKGFNG